MKLSSDTLFNNLSEYYSIEVFGPRIEKLVLERPLFHIGPVFPSNSVSIAGFDQLMKVPEFEILSLIICLGGEPPKRYLMGQCTCFVIKECTDLMGFFNQIHKIYNKYDEWESRLHQLMSNPQDPNNLQKIIDISFPFFRNPIIIIDSNFRLQAYSGMIDYMDGLEPYRPDENGNLRRDVLSSHFRGDDKMELNIRDPFIQLNKANGVRHLCKNLFMKDMYAGNLTIPFVLDEMRTGDMQLFKYFSDELEYAFVTHASILSENVHILHNTLELLLKERPLSKTEQQYLNDMHATDARFVCYVMKMESRSHNSMPVKYVCNTFEGTIPHSIALNHDSNMVVIINKTNMKYTDDVILNAIKGFLRDMKLSAAKSCEFSDISKLYSYYRQACLSFELGKILNPDDTFFDFEDYKLQYMIVNCSGEFSSEMLYTSGIQRLQNHDNNSQNSYIETLRTYLNNNMNITQTANDLYIHRSTFLQRMSKIEELLNMDLKMPDQRLYLQIVLKSMDLNQKVSIQATDLFEL